MTSVIAAQVRLNAATGRHERDPFAYLTRNGYGLCAPSGGHSTDRPSASGGWILERSMWWFIIGIVALIVVVAIVLNRRGSTAGHDLSNDHHPDTSMGGFDPH